MRIAFQTYDEGAVIEIRRAGKKAKRIAFNDLDDALEAIADELGTEYRGQYDSGLRIGKKALDIGDIEIVDEKGCVLTEWKKPQGD